MGKPLLKRESELLNKELETITLKIQEIEMVIKDLQETGEKLEIKKFFRVRNMLAARKRSLQKKLFGNGKA